MSTKLIKNIQSYDILNQGKVGGASGEPERVIELLNLCIPNGRYQVLVAGG
jgi:hypothetical protein